MRPFLPVAAAAGVLMALSAPASAAVFEYTGAPLVTTVGVAPHPTGPISAMIEIDDAALLANATLDQTDIISFTVTSAADGLTWTSSLASYVLASFTLDATATGFAKWGFVVEQELVSGNTGVEQVAIENRGIFGSVIDEIAFGDDRTGDKASLYEVGAFTLNSPGQWTLVAPVPLPGGAALLLGGLALLGFVRVRRQGRSVNAIA